MEDGASTPVSLPRERGRSRLQITSFPYTFSTSFFIREAIMETLPEGFAELKQRMRAMWMAGDFGEIAKLNSHGAEDFIGRLHLKPGTKVLDGACGTGHQSLRGAAAGARVV